MTQAASDAALAAYWRFFETFNTREGANFSSALQFPHLRISPHDPEPRILPQPDLVAEGTSYARIAATGWDHTVGAEPEVIHTSTTKVHIRGGWTRYDKDDNPILTNFVTYIMTVVNGNWAIQCRFGVDPGQAGETDATVGVALETVDAAFGAMASGNRADAARFFNYPHFSIDPGEVTRYPASTDLEAVLPGATFAPGARRAIQSGPKAANIAFDASFQGRPMQGMLFVTERDGHWGIEGRSLIL